LLYSYISGWPGGDGRRLVSISAGSRDPSSCHAGKEQTMRTLGFTQQELDHIIRVCRRAPVDEFTTAPDLKRFLLTRLQLELPDAAARLGQLDEQQTTELWQEVLEAIKTEAGSALW
jgi:hypothetical protein